MSRRGMDMVGNSIDTHDGNCSQVLARPHVRVGMKLLAALCLPVLAVAVLIWGLSRAASGSEPAPVDSGAGLALIAESFDQAAPQGLDGGRGNGWAWSMAWWNDYLYVGTNHNFHCLEALAQNRALLDYVPYPPPDPDVDCPADPLELDVRAEVWRWSAATESWQRVYQSPTTTVTSYTRITGTLEPLNLYTQTIPISETAVAFDVGYRGMAILEEPGGAEALYVTGVTAQFAGYPVPPPRILRSTDGIHFAPIPQDPATVMGDLEYTSLRNPVVHEGSDGAKRMYVTAGSSQGSGVLLESERPWEGNDSFRRVTSADLEVSSAASYNGSLYVGARDTRKGFSLLKMDVDGGSVPYSYTAIIRRGGEASVERPNAAILSMQEFGGRLYLGGSGIRVGPIGKGNAAAELFRVDPDDSWDLVVGDVRLFTLSGPKFPLSGYGPGFENDLNGHIWSMAVHQGYLYVATFDSSTFLKDDDHGSWGNLTGMGFDLYRSADGERFEAVTVDGLSCRIDDPDPPRPDLNLGALDFGTRTLVSTPQGLFLGTTSNYYGLRIWRGAQKEAPFRRVYLPLTLSGSD